MDMDPDAPRTASHIPGGRIHRGQLGHEVGLPFRSLLVVKCFGSLLVVNCERDNVELNWQGLQKTTPQSVPKTLFALECRVAFIRSAAVEV